MVLIERLMKMMTSRRRYHFLISAVICILAMPAFAAICPKADLTSDCMVDLSDLEVLADQWLNLEPCEGSGVCADLDSQNGVNFADFTVMSNQWRTHGKFLFINEFMASNSSSSGIKDPQNEYDDWIEIYNAGDTSMNLAGMYLTDNLGNPTKYQIPSTDSSQTTIPAGGFVVFWADEDSTDGPLHTNFKLSGSGEEIGLFDTDGVTRIDAVVFGEQTTNISYGRYPDGSETWRFFPVPTPAADNNGAYLGEIEKVEFSKERGFYDASFNLTLACTTSGANIYYTTDGRSPVIGEVNTPTSIRYTTQIPVSSSKNYIRAAAIKTGWKPAPIETHTYIYGASDAIKSMPVFAIVGDPNESLWAPNGVMSDANRSFGYEKPVSLEVIDSAADSNYQIDCGLRIHGNARYDYTVGDDWLTCWVNWWPGGNMNKFSFRFYFRSEYGNNRFEYPFFIFTPEVSRQQCIVLRGGKNDMCTPFVKDEFWRRLFKEMGGVQLTGRLVNLYINGVYKAFYNPTGRSNAQFYQEFYQSQNAFDVITNGGDGVIRDGDMTAWTNFLGYIDTQDLSIPANYDYVASKFDITNFIDYLIVQIHSGNFDWPNNNWDVHRERTDNGKFRFGIWDAEGTELWYFGSNCEKCADTAFHRFPSYDQQGLNRGPWPICRIYRKLKANPNFRQLFADRIHKHYNNDGIMSHDYLMLSWAQTVDEVRPVLPWIDSGAPAFIANVFLPRREPYVLAAFHDSGLFNNAIGAPVFNVNGSYKFGGYVSTSDNFTITDPCGAGAIYYTLDGNDPRLPTNGALAAEFAAKKMLIPLNNSVDSNWRNVSFNDSIWTSVTGSVGYERGTSESSTFNYLSAIDVNIRTDMYNKGSSCYIRLPFTLNAGNLVDVCSVTLRVRYDDGFVAYINGVKVASRNAPASPTWSSVATANIESYGCENIDISSYAGNLLTGSNVLAIHGLNYSKTDNDFLMSAELEIINGGGIYPNAQLYTGPITLNRSSEVKARCYKNSTRKWSAINEAPYEVGNLKNSLRITEIMYNPADTCEPNDEDREYIELKNTSSSTINLNLVKFDKGVDFTFGPNTLATNQHILVVRNKAAFEAKYGTGLYIAGEYSGSLDNGGERIRLLDAVGGTIHDFNYHDGWRSIVDGDGYSLTIINPADSDVNHWGKKDYWRASAYINGSPGQDDSGFVPNPGAIVINEVLAHSHDVSPDWIELKNTTAGPIDIGGWYLSDSDTNLMKYRFAAGTTIPANGYLVVYENNNFGNTAVDAGRLIPFALSENGDTVCLASSLDENSKLTGYREKEEFGASETGVSFGRYYKASTNSYNFVPMSTITPGSANSYPQVGPIVITEIMYNPDWPATGNYANDEYEYIELRNTSASAVTLYDSNENLPWKFTNGIDYTFGSTVTINNGAKIVVVKNPTAFSTRYPSVPAGIIYGPYSGKLANEGEQIELSKPGDVDGLGVRQYIRVERVDYSDGSHSSGEPGDVDLWPIGADGLGSSLTRTSTTQYGNDPNNWSAATPTPGT
jgi:hypothetical protein